MDQVDPFTLRMLERARLRQEKLESKLQPSDRSGRSKRPLKESNNLPEPSTIQSPIRKNGSPEVRSNQENVVSTINRTLKRANVSGDSELAVEINIVHQNNVQVDVQVEEREISLVQYLKEKELKMESQSGSPTCFHSIDDPTPTSSSKKSKTAFVDELGVKRDHSNTRAEMSEDGKSKLRRLGQLYSNDPTMSSPVNNRKEISSLVSECQKRNEAVTSTTSASDADDERSIPKKRANRRFADLANRINNMEDDIRHIDYRSKDKGSKKTQPLSTASKSTSITDSNVRVTRRSVGKMADKSLPKTSLDKKSPRPSISNIKSPRPSISNIKSPRQSNMGLSSPKSTLSIRQSPRQSSRNLPVKESPLVKRTTRQSIVNLLDKETSPSSRIQEAKKMFQSSITVSCKDKKQTGVASIKSPIKWDQNIIEDLKSKGFKRVSVSQSRLVYDFSSSNHQQAQGDKPTPVSNMAAVAVTSPSCTPRNNLTKRPSIKKHRAPQPPKDIVVNGDNEKENSSSDNFVSSVEDLINGKSENDSGSDVVSQKESIYSTPEITRSQHSLHSVSSSNRSSPITRHKNLADNSNGSPGGNNVMSMAAIFETQRFDSPRGTDPALMSMKERKALFEKNKGQVPIPKAAFGMAPPIKALHGSSNDKGGAKKPLNSINIKSKIEPKPEVAPIHTTTARIANLGYKMAHVLQPNMGEKDILDKAKKQREEEMIMLKNRFNKAKMMNAELDNIETDIDQEQTSEDSPLMGSGDSRAARVASSLSINKKGISNKDLSDDDDPTEADGVVGLQPTKRRSSTDAPQVVSALEDVKRIKVAKPKEGKLYPCLSDIEQPTTEDEKQSCLASSLNTSSDSAANEKVNDDANWGDTSFGQDLLKVAGVKKSIKNIKKATRLSREKTVAESREDSDASSCNNSELDNLLDDVMDEGDSEGPTPPKQNKNTSLPSTSFLYKRGTELAPNMPEESFKSPLKTPPRNTSDDSNKGKPLVHTISFYRKLQQNQQSCNNTPVRVVHRDQESNKNSEKEAVMKIEEKALVKDTKARIKKLLEEVAKQNTIISQASQALNLCAATIEFSGSTEQAEGERLLLLATHRRQACLHEVQRLQIEGLPGHTSQLLTLRMEDFSLPLKREYVRQLNADGALGHYIVCLIKCQERVISTSMVKTAPDSFYVTFPDKVRLEGLDPNFKITVEIYSLQASKEVLPHDVKYHIATKKSGKLATPRKGCKGADLKAPLPIASPGGPSAVRAPALQLHGYCIFGYSQIARNNFSLNKVSGPLDGVLKLSLSIEKRVVSLPPRPDKKGFLTMFEEAGGFGAWHRRWCVLRGQDLNYWRYPDQETSKTPMGSIEMSSVVSEKVTQATREVCARPHTILLVTSTEDATASPTYMRRSVLCLRSGGKTMHLLAADTKEEKEEWLEAFNLTLSDIRAMNE